LKNQIKSFYGSSLGTVFLILKVSHSGETVTPRLRNQGAVSADANSLARTRSGQRISLKQRTLSMQSRFLIAVTLLKPATASLRNNREA
jgi:hypothetical protein